MTLEEFGATHFSEASKPKIRTLRAWIKAGTFPYHAEKLGKAYYVDPDRPIETFQDPLFQKVLNA